MPGLESMHYDHHNEEEAPQRFVLDSNSGMFRCSACSAPSSYYPFNMNGSQHALLKVIRELVSEDILSLENATERIMRCPVPPTRSAACPEAFVIFLS